MSKASLVEKFGAKLTTRLLNKFTITYPAPMGTYRLKKEIYGHDPLNKDILFLPRFAEARLREAKFLKRVVNRLPPGEDIIVNFLGLPTHNQEVTARHMLDQCFTQEGGGCTLDMQPGEGKTFLAMYLIGLVKKKTLIVVPNTYLLKQWVKCLEEFTDATVGVYYGEEKRDGDVVVGIVNSLVQDQVVFTTKTLLPPKLTAKGKPSKRQCWEVVETRLAAMEYFSRFGMAVLDESHTYATDAFRKLYNVAQCRYMVGLSATPNEREHGLDRVSHYNLGDVLDAKTIEGYQVNAVSMASTVELVEYSGPDHLTQTHLLPSTNTVFVPRMIEDLHADEARNQLIVDKTIELMLQGLNVFVFTERRAHAELLSILLSETLSIEAGHRKEEGDSIVVMYGGVSDGVIDTAKDCASVVFTTYAYSSTGVSIDRMTGLVLASPRRSKATQVVGRIFRQNPSFNEVHRRIVDIVDKRSLLASQLRSRMPAYRSRGSEILRTKVSYQQFSSDGFTEPDVDTSSDDEQEEVDPMNHADYLEMLR